MDPTHPHTEALPLDRLQLSPHNIRKTDMTNEFLDKLQSSLQAHGQLSNLIAREIPSNKKRRRSVPGYEVIAGGRRLAAYQALAKSGAITSDHRVRCLVVANDTPPEELSLAENEVRAPLHPADRIIAIQVLTESGASVSELATHFGIGKTTIQRDLRLASVAPCILEAYRDKQIDLDTLKAYASTEDRQRQIEAWETSRRANTEYTVWGIRRFLNADRTQATGPIARFVGLDAYEAAGGAIDRDLFADEEGTGTWLCDPSLLRSLASEKLNNECNARTPPWKWATFDLDSPSPTQLRYGRVFPQPAQPTDEEQGEQARLRKRQRKLSSHMSGFANPPQKDREEYAAIRTRLQTIDIAVHARDAFRDEDFTNAGCLLTVNFDGTLRVIEGLVQPEDLPAKPPARTSATSSAAGSNPHESHSPKAQISTALGDELRCLRNALAKAHLANDFNCAFDLLLFELSCTLLPTRHDADALAITALRTDTNPMPRDPATFDNANAGARLLEQCPRTLNLAWRNAASSEEAFTAMCTLPTLDKQKLFSFFIAQTLHGQLSTDPNAAPHLERSIERLAIDFASLIRPTAQLFFTRIVKRTMLDIAETVLGKPWAARHAKLKKGQLADAMDAAFNAPDDPAHKLIRKARETAKAWTMPGFAPRAARTRRKRAQPAA